MLEGAGAGAGAGARTGAGAGAGAPITRPVLTSSTGAEGAGAGARTGAGAPGTGAGGGVPLHGVLPHCLTVMTGAGLLKDDEKLG